MMLLAHPQAPPVSIAVEKIVYSAELENDELLRSILERLSSKIYPSAAKIACPFWNLI
jgi:hypothetical protein